MFPVTSMAGSIVYANALATTITINCVKGNSVCNRISGAITAIQGPSTWSGHIVAQTNILGIQAIATVQSDCTITASTKFASCAETVMLVGKADGSAVTSTMSKEISVPSSYIAYESLFITAGLDKLNRPQATQTPGTAPAKVTANMALAAGGAVAGAAVALAEFL
ncbi:hypothetical protein BGW36DRAFT_371130 [Talaromyces proteolyticus]|uniref:GPI anchored cell wall protein n=1 Tax=Talaromyces proteolyticus TaxID=1131652 RepID=A0AAD4KWF8_9EURO|nr:uncharacterized protein BGW36DRAFT_371130 [Talaromyces proteolyticus]KAH8701575.1 hypothetical protein BGW36DRAFT_371130 [Talaromyces proteolyticus]